MKFYELCEKYYKKICDLSNNAKMREYFKNFLGNIPNIVINWKISNFSTEISGNILESGNSKNKYFLKKFGTRVAT